MGMHNEVEKVIDLRRDDALALAFTVAERVLRDHLPDDPEQFTGKELDAYRDGWDNCMRLFISELCKAWHTSPQNGSHALFLVEQVRHLRLENAKLRCGSMRKTDQH